VKGNAGFKVTELTKALNAKHVETRPIIAGNIARQPALKMYEHRGGRRPQALQPR